MVKIFVEHEKNAQEFMAEVSDNDKMTMDTESDSMSKNLQCRECTDGNDCFNCIMMNIAAESLDYSDDETIESIMGQTKAFEDNEGKESDENINH